MTKLNFTSSLVYLLRPMQIIKEYKPEYLRPDLIAGITVAVVLLPQAIAFAIIAELPPQMGIYTAIVGGIVGALWGSSRQMNTGPTNPASLLVLSALMGVAIPGTPRYLAAAGMLAIMAGILRLVMGMAKLGVLVNFVSDAVIVGFSAGAGVLIGVNQLKHLFRVEFPGSPGMPETLYHFFPHLPETHFYSLALGLGTLALVVLLQYFAPKLPGPLIAMVAASVVVWGLGLDKRGVIIIGKLPPALPPLAELPLFDLQLLGQLSTGALAIATIGLVAAASISRSIAAQTGQRLDSNQEFVGQGLASLLSGVFSGYAASGSFGRSAVNYGANAKTALSSIFASLFVFTAITLFSPAAAYIPRAALSGVLLVMAYGMIDRKEMARIWRGARGDAFIMVATLSATLLLPLEFAVLIGILASFARYALETSVPKVQVVLPDDNFNHLIYRPGKPSCPQLGIIDILGDLYFGAVSHVEDAIQENLKQNPEQRFLLLRMRSVNHCDINGIHMLESVMRLYRQRGGDLYLMRVQGPVRALMRTTGFRTVLGIDHFLPDDGAVTYLFEKILDPAVCIYECEIRAFYECQNLPKQTFADLVPLRSQIPPGSIPAISPQRLHQQLNDPAAEAPLVLDVREAREFRRSHIPQARLFSLSKLLSQALDLPKDRQIVCVCRTGRRSSRAVYVLQQHNYEDVAILRGGMIAWEAAGYLEAVEL